MKTRSNHSSLRKDKRAISPAISTVILTAAGIVMILVAMTFANNSLNTQMASNEFNTNQQFMQTTGLQIDDIAWMQGRTQTVTYSSKFGSLNFNGSALDYTFQVDTSSGWVNFSAPATGIVEYNMPVDSYSIGNNYFARVPLSTNGSFLQSGSSAPVAQVFCEEQLVHNAASYARIVLVPTIRMLNSTITGANPTTYFEFYLPYLSSGGTTHATLPSLILTGENVTKITETSVNKVIITTSPNINSGFNAAFFNFPSTTVTLNIPNSIVEFYFGQVQVIEGQV